MQKTKLGGDEVARAIWDVGKAIESLSGPLKDGGKSGGGAGFVPQQTRKVWKRVREPVQLEGGIDDGYELVDEPIQPKGTNQK
jgi:hypothetical protein